MALLSGGALILIYIALGFLLPIVPTHEDWLAAQTTLPNASCRGTGGLVATG